MRTIRVKGLTIDQLLDKAWVYAVFVFGVELMKGFNRNNDEILTSDDAKTSDDIDPEVISMLTLTDSEYERIMRYR